MRAALAGTGWLPIFSTVFHLPPWEIDRLTWGEVEEYQDAYNARS